MGSRSRFEMGFNGVRCRACCCSCCVGCFVYMWDVAGAVRAVVASAQTVAASTWAVADAMQTTIVTFTVWAVTAAT